MVAHLDAADHLDPALRVSVPAHELLHLYRKLQTQPVIEEANGILMGHYGLNADTAFRLLRRWSQHVNIKVRTLAQALVDAVVRQPCSEFPPHDLIQQLGTTRAPASQTV